MEKSNQRVIVFHPILFAIYPPLALLANNILQIRAVDAVRSIIVFLILGVVLFLLSRWILHDRLKAGIVATVLVLSFSSYGQVYNLLEASSTWQMIIGRHRYLAPLWVILTGLLVWWLIRRKTDFRLANIAFNLFSIVLVIMPSISLINNAWLSQKNARANAVSVAEISSSASTTSLIKPDVYYIILDMYGRDDILLERFSYDNSEFLEQLESMGFYIARCSITNYNMTELSMASSFNMNYLDTLGDQYTAGNTDRSGLPSLIYNSAVRQIFEGMGYKFINFETGFNFLEIRDAYLFLGPSDADYKKDSSVIRLNAFESMLVKTTAFSIINAAEAKWSQPVNSALDTRKAHIVRQVYTMEKLQTIPVEVEAPKFVYTHLLIPHPPFVFSKDGINLSFPGNDGATTYGPSEKDYKVGYRNQLDYINQAILPILKHIIEDSDTPPIIILQGDHGVDPKRSYNLNAYYFPGQGKDTLYPTVSPVNSFRLILNNYFDGNYELLPDINYASSDKKPFDYEITKDDRVCQN